MSRVTLQAGRHQGKGGSPGVEVPSVSVRAAGMLVLSSPALASSSGRLSESHSITLTGLWKEQADEVCCALRITRCKD